jgi:hypothetical protein
MRRRSGNSIGLLGRRRRHSTTLHARADHARAKRDRNARAGEHGDADCSAELDGAWIAECISERIGERVTDAGSNIWNDGNARSDGDGDGDGDAYTRSDAGTDRDAGSDGLADAGCDSGIQQLDDVRLRQRARRLQSELRRDHAGVAREAAPGLADNAAQ